MSILRQIQNLTKHSAIYAISTAFQKLPGFILLPFYTNTEYIATREEFGDYAIIYTFIAFMYFVYTYGMDSALMRFFFLGGRDRKTVYSTTLLLLLGTSILTSLVVFFFSEPIAAMLMQDTGYGHFVVFAAAILFTDTLGNLPYLMLRAEEKSVQYSVFRGVRFTLEMVFNILFVIIFKLGVMGIIYTTLVVSVINLLITLPVTLRNFTPAIDVSLCKEMLTFGLPFLPHGIAYSVIELVDRIIILDILDRDAVGLYSANYKFGAILSVLILAFRNAWQPFFLKIANDDNARVVYARVMTYFVLGAGLVILFGTFFIYEILTVTLPGGGHVFGQEYWEGISLIPIILTAYCFYGMYIVMTPGFYIEKKGQYMILFSGSAAVVNIAGNFLLIPHFHIWGAAIATLLSYATMAAIIIIVSNRIYPIAIEWMRLGKIFLIVASTATLNYYMDVPLLPRIGLFIFVLFFCYKWILYDEESRILQGAWRRRG